MPRLLVLLLVVVLAGCGGTVDDPRPGPAVTPPAGLEPTISLPPAEDELSLVSLPGYVHVAGFEQRTGCRVDVTRARDADELVRLMSTGRFDGGLGMGDAMVRLLSARAVAPVNTDLVPQYENVYDGLRDQPYNSVGGQMFALPVGRAANVLLYRRDKVPGTLSGLAAVLDSAQAASYGGQIVVPDDPANIAEAALWLARQRPELEITDPYELDRRQFQAVLDILRHQQPYIERYWSSDTAVLEEFRSGQAIVGMVSQRAGGILEAEGHPEGPFEMTLPREGSTGISPAWMVAAGAEHPGCMYRWLNHALDPAVQSVVSRSAAIAPSNRLVCERPGEEPRCETFHAGDDGYYEQVLFRTVPARDCGDARGRACTDGDAWRAAWADITS